MKEALKGLGSKRDSRYVAKSDRKRSGWDEKLRSDKKRFEEHGYSDYFFRGEKFYGNKDLILRGFEMASAFVKSMNLPFKPLLSVNKKESFSTGRVIALSTDVFDKKLPDGKKLDVFIGLAIHECLHCEKTNFEQLSDFIDGIVGDDLRLLAKRFWNIIEDERIELSDVAENPGHGNFISALKEYHYKIDLEFKEGENILRHLVNFFTALVRYPEVIQPEMYASFEKEYEEAKRLLEPFPETNEETFEKALALAKFIYDLHKKLIEEKVKKKYLVVDMPESDEPEKMEKTEKDSDEDEMIPIPKKRKKGKKDDSLEISEDEIINPEDLEDEEAEDSTSKTPEKGKKKSDIDKKTDKDKESSDDESEETSDDFYTETGEKSDKGSDDKKKVSKKKKSKSVSNDAEEEGDEPPDESGLPDEVESAKSKDELDILKEIEEEIKNEHAEEQLNLMDDSIESTIDKKTASKSYAITEDVEEEIMETYAESIIRGYDKKTKFIVGIGNEHIYKTEEQTVSNFASTLSRMLQFNHKDMKICLKGMRYGKLDTNRLAEAVQGIPHIYETFGMVKSQKGAVGLLIDESGSMGGTNIANARKAAIVFEKAIEKLSDIELFIYGHTADEGGGYGSTTIRIYREKGRKIPYGIGGCMGRHENRDGTAILETAKRIRKLTDRPCVLFVISDGEPAASGYGGTPAMEDVRIKVLEAEKLNFVVVEVAIYKSSRLDKMFKRFVTIDKVNELPIKLGFIMKQVVSELFKAKTTY